MRITFSEENHKKYHHVDFHILNIGEKFSFKNENYIKQNDDGAIKVKSKAKNKKFYPFWPQTSIKMTNYYTLDELIKKYPSLVYSY